MKNIQCEKMKILQISNSFKPAWEAGGTTRVVYEISCALSNKGHSVTVYTTDRGQKRVNVQKNRPVPLDNLIVYYFSNISNYLAMKLNIVTPYYLLFIARKELKNFDIIHIHEHRTFFAIVIHYYANKYNIPYIVQAHGSVMPFYQKTWFKKLFDKLWGNDILNNASNIIAITGKESEQYMVMGVPEQKITIIPNGINLSEFQNLPEKGKFREKYSIRSDEKVILYLGRINKIKGLEMLMEAFYDVSNHLKKVKLVIAGPDDGFLGYLKEMSIDLRLGSKVIFVGPLYGENKLEAYIDSDIYILPSLYEIFGITLLESILCGTPVICTKECGISDIIDGEAGISVPNTVNGIKEGYNTYHE